MKSPVCFCVAIVAGIALANGAAVTAAHADSVVGRPIPHGRSLLVRLQEWAAQPAFSYRHEWQEGDLVIWDNCGCMHRVVPYDENSGRRMHRTTIMGEERVAGSARHG